MDDSCVGLTLTRMAGCSAPETLTSATPSTCEMRCTSTESAASNSALGGNVLDVNARMITGMALGFALRNVGSVGMSDGRSA